MQGSERATEVSASEEQWWLPMSERLAAAKGSAPDQVVVQPPDVPDQTPSTEGPRRSSLGLALAAVLAAAASAGLTSWWLRSQRPVPSQNEPQAVAVAEVPAPQTQSPSLSDIPLPQPALKNDGVAPAAPAAKSPQRPASAQRRAGSEPPAAAPSSSERASAPSSSAAPDVPSAPVVPQAQAPVQAPAAPESPVSPRTPFFSSTDVTEQPEVVTRVEPRLPDELVNNPVNDVVVVRLLVSQTGHPFRISLLRRSKVGAPLDDAVIAAVNRWTFSPARKKGEAVSCWLNVGVPIRSSSGEATATSVAKLGEAQTADQSHHTARSRQ